MGVSDTLGRIRRLIEPPPRLVDWSLLAFVTAEVVTGLVSFTVGTPRGWPVFWLHRGLGFAIVGLLAFKLARVRHRVLDPSLWQLSTVLSLLALVGATGALTTGLLWVFGVDIRIGYWTLLSVHVGFGLVLLPVVLLHASTRFRLPRRTDFETRRTTLQYTVLLLSGAVVARAHETLNEVLGTPGRDRRFTGSQPREGTGNEGFPVTSWVADDPDPIDLEAYRLTVTGLVDRPLEVPAEQVAAGDTTEELLDCTSGWYTVREWEGVAVGRLLERAGGVADGGTHVRFVSVTGYRWSLPIEEAEDALLATHVDGERLSHGHGAPARLVAPGRRGFQWVKWVTRVEVRDRSDPAQWLVTLVSGFD